MADIQQHDIGVRLVLTLRDQDDALVDLSDASALQILLKKPDKTILTKTASLYTDGTDGKLQYTSTSGVLDQAGVWQLQALVEFSTNQFRSNVDTFRVNSNVAN